MSFFVPTFLGFRQLYLEFEIHRTKNNLFGRNIRKPSRHSIWVTLSRVFHYVLSIHVAYYCLLVNWTYINKCTHALKYCVNFIWVYEPKVSVVAVTYKQRTEKKVVKVKIYINQQMEVKLWSFGRENYKGDINISLWLTNPHRKLLQIRNHRINQVHLRR